MSSPMQATSSSSTLEPAAVYLPPGLLYAAATPGAVTTVLGSCVAVCLFDHTRRAGGINHFLLPYWNGDGLASPKYANIALPKLLEKMIELGCRRQNLRAKLFGGGGHMHAAGCRLKEPFDDARSKVLRLLFKMIGKRLKAEG